MIGYATVGTNDIAAARRFFDELLEVIGAKRLMEFGEEGNGFTMWGTAWDKPGLAVTGPYDKKAAQPGNGTMVAFAADKRAVVDALHAKALALGGRDEGAPGVRGDDGPQAFYAAYFRDLDGNKFCAFKVGPDA